MPSDGDRKLAAALENLKVADADYLEKPTPQAERELARAMSGLANEMGSTSNPKLRKRAVKLREVKERFESTKSPKEKCNIAATVGRTLVNITVKKLVFWGIGGVATLAVAGSLMYSIASEGQWTAAWDDNQDGWTDRHDFDIDHDGIADQSLVDTDHDLDFDTIVDTHTGAVEASGTIVEGVIDFFSNLF